MLIKIRIPSRFMSETASEAEKEVFAFYKKVADDLVNGVSRGIVLPSDTDPETRQRLFDIEIH
ncbi:hypothetical protein QGX11_gp164 [Pseudomonas phage PPSC2]|uniref:Uncharacterized protein n=1 Tax=Pseudomonas phage PPSC2 TaxID=2041350 RepID=A0A2R2YB03_9CAUD|nr:hypothetical protein QGX11_gp164 [Pseudomonas phage PPSC2]ATN92927.1 hypothetical protein PPSC2_164 [Pseudomonas phage PPSC2]